MEFLRRLTLSFLFVFLFSGCTIRLVDFTVLSTKNVQVPIDSTAKRVTGEDCVIVILFPFGIPNMEEAVDQAIESAGPGYDALVDGVLYQKNHAFLIGQICYVVEGTAINTKTSVSLKEKKKDRFLFHSQRTVNVEGEYQGESI